MKEPENFEDFCESLTCPYSTAKQYFDKIMLKIDVYHDTTYFYEFFANLEDKKKDTVYNNLQRLYDVTKSSHEENEKRIFENFKEIQNSTKYNNKSDSRFEQDFEDFLKKMGKMFDELKFETNKGIKITALNQLLLTADNYTRSQNSVLESHCNSKCVDYDTKLNEIKKHQMSFFNLVIIGSALVSVIVSLTSIYVYLKVGSKVFVDFIEKNFWLYVFVPAVTSFVGLYIKYYCSIKKYYK